jgi:hypothetical protein
MMQVRVWQGGKRKTVKTKLSRSKFGWFQQEINLDMAMNGFTDRRLQLKDLKIIILVSLNDPVGKAFWHVN